MENQQQDSSETKKNVGGRPRRTDRPKAYSVYLPEDTAEWAKDEPEGLSGLMTSLLRAERERREKVEKFRAEHEAHEEPVPVPGSFRIDATLGRPGIDEKGNLIPQLRPVK